MDTFHQTINDLRTNRSRDSARPDMILLAGGVDGGTDDMSLPWPKIGTPTYQAGWRLRPARDYAGNYAVRDEVEDLLKDVFV